MSQPPQTQPDPIYNAALGAFLGACVGDAAGAVLEFYPGQIGTDDVRKAMDMPGGGIWRVAPGQITDDSELAMCLAHGLAQGSSFSAEHIARQYLRWYQSRPFDIGNTTRNAVSAPLTPSGEQWVQTRGVAHAMLVSAQDRNMGSKANGSLMRCTPLAVWGHRLDDHDLAQHAMVDSRLTHPNESCQHAVACYVIACAHLISGRSDRKGAFEAASAWADQCANEEVRTWLQDARQGVEVPFEHLMGFVRIAFTHAFRHLWLGTSYTDAIEHTLNGGGDTDTNAAIVGGLLGAAEGASAIPAPMKTAVLQCNTLEGRPRPDFLHPQHVPALVTRLLELAPGSKESSPPPPASQSASQPHLPGLDPNPQ